MADDFKLSVDVAADLTKLDSTLNVAQQKVSAAGNRMQRALGFFGGEGNTNVFTEAGFPAIGLGMGGLAASAPLYGQFLGINANIMAGQRGQRTSAAALQNFGRFGTPEFLQGQITAISARENYPIIGNIWAAARRFAGERMLQAGASTGDIGALLNTAQQVQSLDITNQLGFMGGGFPGRLRELEIQRNLNLKAVQQKLFSEGPNSAIQLSRSLGETLSRERSEALFSRSQTIQTLAANTQSANLRAFGLGGMASLVDVENQFRPQIELARTQGDHELMARLQSLKSAAMRNVMFGGLQPAQQIGNPADYALGQGAVRLGTLNGQSEQFLRQIADNTSSGYVPTIGRN